MNPRRGIPTTYAGTRFRSRLEARWAHLFDALGWRWEYEPFDLDGYVPDFVLLGDKALLIEVKPAVALAELEDHVEKVQVAKRDTLIVGATPRLHCPDPNVALLYDLSGGDRIFPTVGLLVQWGSWVEDGEEEASEGWAEQAVLSSCYRCREAAVFHTMGAFVGYPCGHYEGGSNGAGISERVLDRAWAEARNRTQWASPGREREEAAP
jgi:hypothetical protein